MKIELHSDAESMVKAMPRIETLYYFVYELAQCFHADRDTLNSIRDGILENQILKSITMMYLNKAGEKIAEIVIDIDWEKHFLLAKTDTGKYIEIDMSKTIVSNIVSWKKYVVKHLDEVMKQFGANCVQSIYHYRDQLTRDEKTHSIAREIMGHVLVTESVPEAINPTLQRELSRAFTDATIGKEISGEYKRRVFDTGVLEEVNISMSYKTRK